MKLLERLAYLQRTCLKDITSTVDSYIARKAYIQKNSAHYRRLAVFTSVVHRAFPSAFPYEADWSVNVTLTEKHTISRDVMIFLDDNRDLLVRLGNCSDYTVRNNTNTYTLTYTFGDIKLMVTYGEASCSRVQVGTRIVEEPIYEVICS